MVRTMLRGYAGKVSLITGVGLIARLALLGYQPLWRDEAFTALAVQRPLGSMIDVVRNDSAPPLFYLIERLFAVVSTSPADAASLPGPGRERRDPGRRRARAAEWPAMPAGSGRP